MWNMKDSMRVNRGYIDELGMSCTKDWLRMGGRWIWRMDVSMLGIDIEDIWKIVG